MISDTVSLHNTFSTCSSTEVVLLQSDRYHHPGIRCTSPRPVTGSTWLPASATCARCPAVRQSCSIRCAPDSDRQLRLREEQFPSFPPALRLRRHPVRRYRNRCHGTCRHGAFLDPFSSCSSLWSTESGFCSMDGLVNFIKAISQAPVFIRAVADPDWTIQNNRI